jgi:hypothetical protein
MFRFWQIYCVAPSWTITNGKGATHDHLCHALQMLEFVMPHEIWRTHEVHLPAEQLDHQGVGICVLLFSHVTCPSTAGKIPSHHTTKLVFIQLQLRRMCVVNDQCFLINHCHWAVLASTRCQTLIGE